MIHLIGLPHTSFDADRFSSCAYTAKAVRTVRMLRSLGRDVEVYWGGDGDGVVSCLAPRRQAHYWGEWRADVLPQVVWDFGRPEWVEFNANMIARVEERIEPGDVVAFVMACPPVIDHFLPRNVCVEIGVGYEGLGRGTFACFESYTWMHNRYGAHGIGDGRAFDAVIPNVVYPDEWDMGADEGYALFVGRLLQRKGPHVAAQIAERAGLRLLMAGAGVASNVRGRITAVDGTVIEGDHVTHVGAVGGQARRDLFAHAHVLICPTLYIGPWEGVHAEAMMSGVPVVAPDYGVFTETLPERQRYRMIRQAVDAVNDPVWERGQAWRDHATALCGPERCSTLYGEWFDRIDTLANAGPGWYA